MFIITQKSKCVLLEKYGLKSHDNPVCLSYSFFYFFPQSVSLNEEVLNKGMKHSRKVKLIASVIQGN